MNPDPNAHDLVPLVVCATEAEAAHVSDRFELVITGLGKVAAAIATTRALTAREQAGLLDRTVVVNLGTAGALRDGVTGLLFPSRVLNHDLSADLVRELGYDPVEWVHLDEGDGSALATGDTFVADPVMRDRLAEVASLVDMEGYAVVAAAHSFGVPVRLVKHISDNANAQAIQWSELVSRSAIVLGDWLSENF